MADVPEPALSAFTKKATLYGSLTQDSGGSPWFFPNSIVKNLSQNDTIGQDNLGQLSHHRNSDDSDSVSNHPGLLNKVSCPA